MLKDELRPKVDVGADGVKVWTSQGTMLAGRFDFVVNQGSTLSLRVTWLDEQQRPIDLSAATAALKIRRTWGDATALASLTHADGITLAATEPNIIIARTAAATAAYSWTRACYDLEVTVGGVTTRVLEGFVTLRKEVTS